MLTCTSDQSSCTTLTSSLCKLVFDLNYFQKLFFIFVVAIKINKQAKFFQFKSNNIIIDACPFLCGICQTQGQIVNFLSLSSSTALASPTTTSACVPIACKNGVVFDPASCSCPCPTGYLAPDCGTYNCAINIPDPQPDCAAPVDCSVFALNCPRFCNNCP